MMKKRYKLTTYLAGAMEHATKEDMISWREKFKSAFSPNDILIYDPVEMESLKVDKRIGEQVDYIKGLKRSGHYDKFFEEMWKIWFGEIDPAMNVIEILRFLRNRKLVDGNYREEYILWGIAKL